MSYGLHYFIEFKSLNDRGMRIEILKQGYAGVPQELLGSKETFTVSIDEEEFLYSPTRLSNASLTVVGSDYLQQLYSTDYQQWQLNAYQDEALVWSGFIKPEIYTQDFSDETFELEVECVSALSVLDNIEYTSLGEEKTFVSVWMLLKRAIALSKGKFNSVVFPHVYSKDEATYKTAYNIFEHMQISENNFFNEDDKAMSWLEVIEELCKLFNWTINEWQGSIVFLDVDHKGLYRKYTPTLSSYVEIEIASLEIQKIGYAGSDHTLDILNGYNKATVKIDNYEIDQTFGLEEDLRFVELLERGFQTKRDKPKRYTLKKIYEAKRNNFFLYTNDYKDLPFSDYEKLTKNEKWLTLGANQVREFDYRIDRDGNEFVEDTKNISFQDAIDVRERIYTQNGVLWLAFEFLDENKKVVELVSENLFYDDGWLAIDFNLLNLDIDMRVHLDTSKNKYEYLPVTLQIGDFYWDGVRSWTKTFKKFNILLTTNDTGERQVKTTKPLFTKPYNVTGYIVPITKPLQGKAKLTIYSTGKQVDKWAHDSAGYLLRNINISYKQEGEIDSKDEDKEDRIYTNVVNENFINELDEIDLKISTYNDDGMCHSKIIFEGSYLKDNLYSIHMNEKVRLEELLIRRIRGQYSKTKFKLCEQLNLIDLPLVANLYDKNLVSSRFIIAGGKIRYSEDIMELQLIEHDRQISTNNH